MRSRPTTPISTILPRLRAIRAAWEMISLFLAEAVMSTPSAPISPVSASTNFTGSSPWAGLQVRIPLARASSSLASSKSTPTTRQPLIRSSSAVSRPIRPRPITTTVSPRVGFSRRIPCKPMAPMTVKAAASSETESGILATRLRGTLTTSA